ncbi:MAG: OmpH family outer membrane protein [Sphingomonadales bacterium]|nr:OmpH family outer membrane protein [Sphingomonadales bacterium]
MVDQFVFVYRRTYWAFRVILVFGLASLLVHYSALGQAQRFVYVDTEFMLGQMTEYQGAQSELKVQVERLNAESEEKKQEIERLYRAFKAESPLLTESMRKDRLEEIKAKETQLLAWQNQQFGPEGALQKRQQELIRPLQDKIFAAVQKYARDKSYDLIFDRAAGNQLLFVNPKFDKSNEILTAMGVVKKSPQAKAQRKPVASSPTAKPNSSEKAPTPSKEFTPSNPK